MTARTDDNAATTRADLGAVAVPGSVIGVLGSGQLGRMLAIEARRMGYRVMVYSDDFGTGSTPAGQVADVDVRAGYDDVTLLKRFAEQVAVVTTEFENVPAATLNLLAEAGVPTRPAAAALAVAQHRVLEKQLFTSLGLPTVRWRSGPLAAAVAAVGFPCVVKSARGGYDGKGQWVLRSQADVIAAEIGDREIVVEELIELAAECSVIVARGVSGDVVTFPVIENHHVAGMLDWSVAPARLEQRVLDQAVAAGRALADGIGYVGVLCVEFFVTLDGRLLTNEFAPRPHNSGHLTIEANVTNQFEQQLRAVCGLALGDPSARSAAAMVQVGGDLWSGGEPNWNAALSEPGIHLHLYGKTEPRSGRKMGHLTALAPTPDLALQAALAARSALRPSARTAVSP